jgi:hypothetical protein
VLGCGYERREWDLRAWCCLDLLDFDAWTIALSAVLVVVGSVVVVVVVVPVVPVVPV